MSVLQVQAEWAAIVEIILLLIWVVCFTLKSIYYGIASASELEFISWPFALSAFVVKIVFIAVHIILAVFLYRSAKQRNDARLCVWMIIRIILGILVVVFLILEIFSLLSVFGFDIYTVFLISLYISWVCFIVYSLLIGRWLIKEIQHDQLIARTMYTMYSGRSPY